MIDNDFGGERNERRRNYIKTENETQPFAVASKKKNAKANERDTRFIFFPFQQKKKNEIKMETLTE